MSKDELTTRWEDYAKKHLLNKKIVEVRYMTQKEKENLGFFSRALVLCLDDDTLIFPSADDEGNNAGALFGQDPRQEELVFPVLG